MATVKLKKESWWIRRMRKAGAYGPLDRALRQWRSLGSVRTNTGVPPNGDRMVYRMNHTTLEIGQGVSTFKGMVGLAAFVFLLCTLSGTYLIVSTLSAHEWEVDHFGVAFSVIGGLFCIPMGIWFLSIFLTDFFGYTDALLR
ncbi:hypothetical protein, partial [Paraburkholderia sp. XV]|uniref:hypothetical protein n=1 Tax=Paraburkholderia sp. XV TaxID=2831520 RepID=UPI001CD20B7A